MSHSAALVVLILLRVAYTQAKRLTSSSQREHMNITVKWGRERIHIPLPPPETPLSALRQQLADETALPASSFKLIHAGAVMKDDTAPISAYGIKAQSTIAIIGGGNQALSEPLVASKKQLGSVRPTEQSTIAQIQTELSAVQRTIQPVLNSFLSTITSQSPSAPPAERSPSWKADLESEHTRLGELLLQTLLRLDVINLDGEWVEARKERKGAIKEVQRLLDKLDNGWKERPSWVRSSL